MTHISFLALHMDYRCFSVGVFYVCLFEGGGGCFIIFFFFFFFSLVFTVNLLC